MEYEVEMDDVTFTYEGGKRPAIEGIDLKVRKGETIMIMGPAGAGKSTICRCLNGLIPHFFTGEMEGEVVVTGLRTRSYPIGYLSHTVGLLFDDPTIQLIAPTVLDEIAFGLENIGVPREEIIRRVEYHIKVNRLEGYEDRNPHTLSGGEQQLCALAAIMAMEPQIYVLDEPTSRLDPIGSSQVYSMIAKIAESREHSMIIVSNKIEELVSIVDRIVVMNEGRIILLGKPREVLEESRKIIETGVKPPQVTQLFDVIKEKGFEFDGVPITLDEAYKALLNIFKSRKREGKVSAMGKKGYIPPGEPVIEAEDVWFKYPDGPIALRGVSLKIYDGELVGIIGQNGSGKTTLVKHFNALLKPNKGKVTVLGIDTATATPADLAKHVGFVFQNPDHQIFARTVRKELEFGPKNYEIPPEEVEKRIDESLKAVKLKKDMLDLVPSSLSTAIKQRVNIASVLMMKPRILVVDEPTTGQDPRMRREIMDLARSLNQMGVTAIVITHDMDLAAEYTDRCILLKDGEVLLEGPSREVYSQPEVLEKTFLRPPQITRLGQMLQDHGLPSDILTVNEMVGLLTERWGV